MTVERVDELDSLGGKAGVVHFDYAREHLMAFSLQGSDELRDLDGQQEVAQEVDVGDRGAHVADTCNLLGLELGILADEGVHIVFLPLVDEHSHDAIPEFLLRQGVVDSEGIGQFEVLFSLIVNADELLAYCILGPLPRIVHKQGVVEIPRLKGHGLENAIGVDQVGNGQHTDSNYDPHN